MAISDERRWLVVWNVVLLGKTHLQAATDFFLHPRRTKGLRDYEALLGHGRCAHRGGGTPHWFEQGVLLECVMDADGDDLLKQKA